MLYTTQPAADAEHPVLNAFSYSENVRTAEQTQRDYTFKRPTFDQQKNLAGDDLNHQAQDYERYDYSERYKASAVGKPFTENRLRGHRRDAQIAVVEGDDPRLIPGLSFQLAGHPSEDFNRWWRSVRITHKGVQHSSQQEESSARRWGLVTTLPPRSFPGKQSGALRRCPSPVLMGHRSPAWLGLKAKRSTATNGVG